MDVGEADGSVMSEEVCPHGDKREIRLQQLDSGVCVDLSFTDKQGRYSSRK